LEIVLTEFGNIDTVLKDTIKAIGKLIPIQKRNINLLAKKIEDIYEKNENIPEFKDAFENLLIELMETEDIKTVYTLFLLLPIKERIKREIIQDLKEAEKTLKIKKSLQNHKELEEILENI